MKTFLKKCFFIFLLFNFSSLNGFSDTPLASILTIQTSENSSPPQINSLITSGTGTLPAGLNVFLKNPHDLLAVDIKGQKNCSEQKDAYLYHQTCEVISVNGILIRWDIDRETAGSEIKSQTQIEMTNSNREVLEVKSIRVKTAYKTADQSLKEREWIDVVTRPHTGKIIRELMTVDYKENGQVSKITLSIYEQIKESELAKLLYYIRSAYDSGQDPLQVRISNLTPDAYENRLFDWHHSREQISESLTATAGKLSNWLYQKSQAFLTAQNLS